MTTAETQLDAGTYEVLRARLAAQAAELAKRADELNARRLEVFGSAQLALVGTERIRTANNCVPRDIVAVDGRMLFGYNVFIGLKPETAIDDVFSLQRFSRDGDAFRFDDVSAEELPELLRDEHFERDFGELYRYYRQAKLLQLRRLDGKLLAVFQIGPRTEDIRVLRWGVAADGTVSYLDSRGERDHVFPPSHDFEWIETTREDHVLGRHPHISIEDEVFVETVGGNLTVKVENNTETGAGVYAEPVDEPLQSLADAEVAYARIGPLILLRMLPYKETDYRYLVFNTRTQDVVRLDGIGQACQRLPEDHGIIFPGGYYLDTGVSKTFDTTVDGLEFERVIRSPNGEDVLYVFHARAEGRSLLLPYNVIRKEVANPIPCHGYSLFDDGTMILFRALSDEPSRVHPMQVWRTPFQSDTYAASQPAGTGPLERVGNADLVRGISDCLSVARMIGEMAPSAAVFEALIAACARVFDHYHWLGESELGDLRSPLSDVRVTAEQVLDEFETVTSLTAQAAEAVDTAAAETASLVRRVRGEAVNAADAWVRRLAEMHRARGRLVTVRELRYADTARVDTLIADLDTEFAEAAQRAVRFLQGEEAFTGYHAEVAGLIAAAGAIKTVAEAGPVTERLDEQSAGLEVLTDVVGGLDIADAVVRTKILERIGEVIGAVNRARATLDARRKELLEAEGRAEFAAEFALLAQAVTGGLAVADTPERCDEQLGRLLLQLENLESRFGEFDDFLASLGQQRTDVYEAFSSRKQALLDERARRADRLVSSAERILGSVTRRAGALGSAEEINTYFAADPMVSKLRSVVEDLRALGDQVRAEELDGRVKAARQEAGRALRDRLDLYGDGGETIRLGRHTFAVNTQDVDLTLVPHDGSMKFAITGTDYRAAVRDPAFEATRPYWDQLLVSESPEVYRAEYLATSILAGRPAADLVEAELLDVVRSVAGERYDEGYARGVHDHDAAAILAALLRLRSAAGLLRYPPGARAAAQLFWAFGAEERARAAWTTRAASLARVREAFGATPAMDALARELGDAVTAFTGGLGLDTEFAGEYLVEELAATPPGFVTSGGARALLDKFRLDRRSFAEDLRSLDALADRYQLADAWLRSFAAASGLPADEMPEAVAIELCDLPRYDSSATLTTTVDGLLGAHPRITGRSMTLRLDETLARTHRFRRDRVPAFRAYQRLRNELVAAERDRLRLGEYQPKVMSAFVRNRLLDEVYLPLIGDNLAKQLGAAGDAKRTDQSGLLLLISPPGYGKTTLMEYVASRLGLVFVKVNGPALGHDVTSVDPADAPNATARQEVEKISFALEQGNNVLLYLDDIQHTSPELLQKFISLCDAQRRMEGVWEGRTRTYDLRGKRFAVCMAGNPYTEQGKRFRIPDMLANRADVWNLGDVLSGKEELFALSYVENALTSNAVLAPLVSRDRSDVDVLVRMARGDGSVRADQLSHAYSAPELEQVLAVLRKLLRVQRTVLANNQAYIASAAQAEASRTEPPFQLQGSYRNMNKLAERIVPAMADAELEALIDDHYAGEAQTLTSGAEANLLKLAELRGRLSASQAQRWAEVKAAYLRERALGGDGEDPMSRAVGAVGLLADRVGAVETAIGRAAQRLAREDA
ncbi:DNA repair ATPase [Amycolatopsis sp. Hca4]|uniref:DNA repair ATPase n=1 Tax=Amycolatopsis sp. Hca4 TaxID=2742131 RepID=UPI001590E314|nr:DNA repair ATPase [Amycolatopsis sp. Hca4]QKV77708.1 DNA repair ATPase [Amycolatopsis sp. Hca4]